MKTGHDGAGETDDVGSAGEPASRIVGNQAQTARLALVDGEYGWGISAPVRLDRCRVRHQEIRSTGEARVRGTQCSRARICDESRGGVEMKHVGRDDCGHVGITAKERRVIRKTQDRFAIGETELHGSCRANNRQHSAKQQGATEHDKRIAQTPRKDERMLEMSVYAWTIMIRLYLGNLIA